MCTNSCKCQVEIVTEKNEKLSPYLNNNNRSAVKIHDCDCNRNTSGTNSPDSNCSSNKLNGNNNNNSCTNENNNLKNTLMLVENPGYMDVNENFNFNIKSEHGKKQKENFAEQTMEITSKDLISFAEQISVGMVSSH